MGESSWPRQLGVRAEAAPWARGRDSRNGGPGSRTRELQAPRRVWAATRSRVPRRERGGTEIAETPTWKSPATRPRALLPDHHQPHGRWQPARTPPSGADGKGSSRPLRALRPPDGPAPSWISPAPASVARAPEDRAAAEREAVWGRGLDLASFRGLLASGGVTHRPGLCWGLVEPPERRSGPHLELVHRVCK